MQAIGLFMTALGAIGVTDGVVTLRRQQAWKLPWQRQRQLWKPEGERKILLGIFALLIGIPRMVTDSGIVILVVTFVALLPMAGAVVLTSRARPARY